MWTQRALSIVVGLSLGLLFTARSIAQSQFSGPVPYFAGPMPQIAALADLNRDGILDLVVADNAFSPNPGFVTVLVGNGDGSFQNGVSYAAGPNPYSIAMGDFNHDGNIDIAVVNDAPSGTISVFPGKGDGTLGAPQTFAVGSLPVSIAAADLNGDGNLDLVTANFGGNVSVLLGNSDGTFKTAVSYAAGSRPMSLVITDLNLDGKLDLAVADEFFPNLSVLLGNGDGTFQAAKSFNAGGNSISIAAGDFNGDGKPDLAVANNIFANGTVSVLLGNGDGTFRPAVDYAAGSSPQSVVAADFNGDGKIDLAVVNLSDQTVSLFKGKGDGTFAAPVNYNAGPAPVGLTAGSLRSPQLMDLVVANFQTNTVSVLLNTGAGGLGFAVETVGATSASVPVTLFNPGPGALNIGGIFLTGGFSGDFILDSHCGDSLAVGANCIINVSFRPTGTGTRTAVLEIIDSAGAIIEAIPLNGTGAGTCTSISDCAYPLLNQRVVANQGGFFVYKDADSGFNHGLPILFGTIDLKTIILDAACIDDPASPGGCSTDKNTFDAGRGTVFSILFPSLKTPQDFAGMNFQDPQNFDGRTVIGNGYDLTPATAIQFDVRSPDGAIVQFGVGGCVSNFVAIGQAWTNMTIPISSLFPPPGNATAQCPPDISNAHILFGLTMSGARSPKGGTVLLDNIQFAPVPDRQKTSPLALALPLSTQAFGVKTRSTKPIPTDQANRNVAATYEAALTALSLLKRGQPPDIENALEITDALDYALHHDNHGAPIPPAQDNSGGLGLHNAYSAGDIALLNDQTPPALGKAGDVRIAGFTGPCPGTGFCEVLDGATGGNNAWAILAFVAAYLQSGNSIYLDDAETIGHWIIANLADRTDQIPFPSECLTSSPNLNSAGYGGYFLGYNDGSDRPFVCGKSTENNADIFAAFNLLAQVETSRGNIAAAAQWSTAAKVSGDFVLRMFDSANGRFFSGTVTLADAATPDHGSCPDLSTRKGNDVINECDFLDADSFIVLAMAGSQAFGLQLALPPLDWNAPLHYVLNLGNTIPDPPNNLNPPNNSGVAASFTQSAAVGPRIFKGFDLIPAVATGVAWEFTGQMLETCNFVDESRNSLTFLDCENTYSAQILQAQNSAPFGDGLGVVASVLPGGDTLSPANQCIDTPFQCIPERVGLAATNWGALADQRLNPLAYGLTAPSPSALNFGDELVATSSSPQAVSVTNSGTVPLLVRSVTLAGDNSSEFTKASDTCSNTTVAVGKSCALGVIFTPAVEGQRTAALVVNDNGLGLRQIALTGTGVPLNNFSVSAIPDSVSTVAGGSATYSISTTTTSGSPQTVALSVTGLPAGATPIFNPPAITSGQSSTLTINTNVTAAPRATGFTISGIGPSAASTARATLNVQSPVSISPASLTFSAQGLATSSQLQQVLVTNISVLPLDLKGVVVTGEFSSDFTQTNDCGATLAAGAHCTLNVIFTPAGVGNRKAVLRLTDNAGDTPQSIPLAGTGTGSCTSVSDCAYQELTGRSQANQAGFFVYQDADSPFNHGFLALFGNQDLLPKPGDDPARFLDAGCIDDPSSSTGCSSDITTFDAARGTVFRLTIPPIPLGEFFGVIFEEPQDFDGQHGNGYDLSPATAVQFDARSPGGAVVQFGVGGCVSSFMLVGQSWTTFTISLASLVPPPGPGPACPPDITHTHVLFSVTQDSAHGQLGSTVLLDNIQFIPVPARQKSAATFSLPVSTRTFGVVPKQAFPIPVDEAVRNLSTVQETAQAILSLLKRNLPGDLENARRMLDSFDYALHNDNAGDPLPVTADSLGALHLGLHTAYEGGDLALFNNQPAPLAGKTGNVRLSGFFAGKTLCGSSGFCEVLDGAFGGTNAWAILAFSSAYLRLGNVVYLNDAETIGNWIIDNLQDGSPTGFGGYFVGFSDGGTPRIETLGKSTEFNADIFAAFNLLSEIENARGNTAAASRWKAAAAVAGNFVVSMFDGGRGRFFAGTINGAFANPSPGVCPDTSLQKGNEVVNTCDVLTQNSFAILALAGSRDFGVGAKNGIDWTLPVLYMQSNFAQSVTASDLLFKGFNLIPDTPGVAWESTAQTVAACDYIDHLLGRTDFEDCREVYLPAILQAQNAAPFGDGLGLVAGTLSSGERLPVVNQCIVTPFQCIPERVALGASAWATFADQQFNPMAFSVRALSASALDFSGQLVKTFSSRTLLLTNTGTAPLSLAAPIQITGANSGDFSETDNCSGVMVGAEQSCSIIVTFAPPSPGVRTATLTIVDNSLNGAQTVALVGTGQSFGVASNSSSASVKAGGTAVYTLTFTPLGGFNQTISLSCVEPPLLTNSTCSLDRSSITLNGTDAVSVAVKVTTSGPSPAGLMPIFPPSLPGFWRGAAFPAILLLAILATLAALFTPRRKMRLFSHPALLLIIAFLALCWVGCGGGGGGGGSTPTPTPIPTPTPTPSGQYTLIINETAGGLTQTTDLTLIVQ